MYYIFGMVSWLAICMQTMTICIYGKPACYKQCIVPFIVLINVDNVIKICNVYVNTFSTNLALGPPFA